MKKPGSHSNTSRIRHVHIATVIVDNKRSTPQHHVCQGRFRGRYQIDHDRADVYKVGLDGHGSARLVAPDEAVHADKEDELEVGTGEGRPDVGGVETHGAVGSWQGGGRDTN